MNSPQIVIKVIIAATQRSGDIIGIIITSFAFGGVGIKAVLNNPQKIEEGISGTIGIATGVSGSMQQTKQKTEMNRNPNQFKHINE